MNAFEYAMNMELDGKKYFEEQAQKMTEPALKRIFEELANDEERHYQIFKAMASGKNPEYEEAFKTSILATAKNIFQKLSESGAKVEDFPSNIKDVWIKARDIEDNAETFYREQAEKTEDAAQKKIWIRIAEEEHKHWVAMNNVVNFIDRPNQWLEDAEWNHMESF